MHPLAVRRFAAGLVDFVGFSADLSLQPSQGMLIRLRKTLCTVPHMAVSLWYGQCLGAVNALWMLCARTSVTGY